MWECDNSRIYRLLCISREDTLHTEGERFFRKVIFLWVYLLFLSFFAVTESVLVALLTAAGVRLMVCDALCARLVYSRHVYKDNDRRENRYHCSPIGCNLLPALVLHVV